MAETTRWRAVGRLSDADPRRVAGFAVQGRLGEGGMGVVYLAEHPDLGVAALKFLHAARAGDETFRARFRREVEAANRVSSPRVARVLAADLDAETPWLATTFIDGPTLSEAVAEDGPMTGERLLALSAALADALSTIHIAGVVHRDLKPANILLTPETPVVIDFGIATAREAPTLTHAGAQLGTPGWMSPEQVRGRRAGPPTDVFAWGLVIAFTGSGRPAFGRGPADALYYRVVHQRPDIGDLPAPLDDLVPAALTKDPRGRPTVAQLMEGLVGGGIAAPVDHPTAATMVVLPTIVAQGWGPEALPRHAPEPRPATEAAMGAVPSTDAVAPSGPTFWYGEEEHREPTSLAAAFQRNWDNAVDRLFVLRNAVWVGDVEAFLRGHDATEAADIVATGVGRSGAEPVGAAMARLLVAMDPHLDPRFGGLGVTPSGLASAAGAVVNGRGQPDRLVEIGDAQVLRLWRSLPGMDDAPAIDERWQVSLREFDRLAGTISKQVGWPSPDQRAVATARLLLFALGKRHARQQTRRLRTALGTAAGEVSWWKRLADQGSGSPAAVVLALMTAEVAEAHGETVRREEAARRQEELRREEARRQAEAAQRAAEAQRAAAARPAPGYPPPGAYPARPRGPVPPAPPPPGTVEPLPRAHGFTRRPFWLVATLAVLGFHVWMLDRFADPLRLFFVHRDEDGLLSTLEGVEGTLGFVIVVAVVAVALHVAARRVGRGRSAGTVRAYAVATAVGDFLVTAAFIQAVTMAVLVARVAGEAPFAPPLPQYLIRRAWAGLVFPFALVGIVAVFLLVRSTFRFLRAVLGRPVGRPVHHPR